MRESRHGKQRLRRRAQPLFRLPAPSRACFVLLALVAVLIQSLVVQTHIHHTVAAVSYGNPSTGLTTLAAPDKSPTLPHAPIKGDDDSSSCALCQAFTHSGQFLHSATILSFVPLWQSAESATIIVAAPVRFALSHSWQGRAPPADLMS
jgi:hypothetical protein